MQLLLSFRASNNNLAIFYIFCPICFIIILRVGGREGGGREGVRVNHSYCIKNNM